MSEQNIIGRLSRVPLREVWRHEAYDFTRWLQENIDVLNAVLSMNLQSVEREQAAGAFSVDLVAEDANGAKVIIENQLERSNHDHLGKVITYLAALKARAAIWIVADPRPEHVSAIGWLNESSSAKFYLVKVEAVRIGSSPAAPLLTLINGPSQETEAIARSNEEFNERQELLSRWWQVLKARPDATLHRNCSAGAAHWMGLPSGVRGLGFNYVVTKNICAAELYIDRQEDSDTNKVIFDKLFENKQAIEAAFGGALDWQRMPDKRGCRVRIEFSGGYRAPEDDWGDIQAPLVEGMNRLEKAFRPYIKPSLVSFDTTIAAAQ